MPSESYGMWWEPTDPANKVAGRLTSEPLKTPVLSLLDPPQRMWAGADLTPGEAVGLGDQFVPMLHGELADRGGVTLLGCHWAGFRLAATQVHQLRVMQAVTGVWLDTPDERFIRRVHIELPGLAALLGRHPVRPLGRGTRRSRQLKLGLDERSHSWRDGATDITWRYELTWSVNATSTSVEMTPTVTLTNTQPQSLEYWLYEWLVPTNDLIAVATGVKSNPRSCAAWMKKNLKPTERRTRRMDIWMQGVGEHESPPQDGELLMNAAAVDLNPNGLPDVIRRLRRLSSEQEVFLGLLSDTIRNPDRPTRNRYLDLASALEAFHSQVQGEGPISRENFKTKKKDVLAAVSGTGLSAEDLRFLKRWLPSRPSYSLEARIQRLAKDTNVLSSWSIRPKRMAEMRNDVAHGNAGIDRNELRQAYDQALDLARRIVLSELGIVPTLAP